MNAAKTADARPAMQVDWSRVLILTANIGLWAAVIFAVRFFL
jgi:hypothetical protein